MNDCEELLDEVLFEKNSRTKMCCCCCYCIVQFSFFFLYFSFFFFVFDGPFFSRTHKRGLSFYSSSSSTPSVSFSTTRSILSKAIRISFHEERASYVFRKKGISSAQSRLQKVKGGRRRRSIANAKSK